MTGGQNLAAGFRRLSLRFLVLSESGDVMPGKILHAPISPFPI